MFVPSPALTYQGSRFYDPDDLPQTMQVSFDQLAIRLTSPLPDAEMDEGGRCELVEGAVGYAWTIHGMPGTTGKVGDSLFVWPEADTLIVMADMASRPVRRRPLQRVLQDLVADVRRFVAEGSPARRDGTRLVGPSGATVDVVLINNP